MWTFFNDVDHGLIRIYGSPSFFGKFLDSIQDFYTNIPVVLPPDLVFISQTKLSLNPAAGFSCP